MAMANELPSPEGKAPAAAIGNTQLLERAVLLLLFGGLLLGILAVLLPFATAILFGAILAIAGWPLRDFLLRRGLRRGLAATLLVLLALACQTARNRDPGSAWKRDPLVALGPACPGSEQEGPPRVAQCPHERRSGARGRCLLAHRGKPGWHSGAVLEAPAVVSGLDDFAVMGQAVEQRGGHLGVAKDARPFAEGQIGRD